MSNYQNTKLNKAYLFIIFLAALLGAAAGGFVVYWITSSNYSYQTLLNNDKVKMLPQHIESLPAVDVETAVTRAVEKISPAVVTVINNMTEVRGGFFGSKRIQRRGSGSGVIVSEDGYIITNNHVVEGFNSIEVILSDGKTLPA